MHNVHERLFYDTNCFQFSDQTRKEMPPGKFLIYTRADERACQWKSLRLVFYEYDKGDCGDVTLIPLNSIETTADTVEVIAFIGDADTTCAVDSVHVSVHPGRKKGDWPGSVEQPEH